MFKLPRHFYHRIKLNSKIFIKFKNKDIQFSMTPLLDGQWLPVIFSNVVLEISRRVFEMGDCLNDG